VAWYKFFNEGGLIENLKATSSGQMYSSVSFSDPESWPLNQQNGEDQENKPL
jgi:hypothetical protein